jgi:ketosteroid isomerase-like protein
MDNAGDVLRKFYAAVAKRDLTAARGCLADNMVFEGLFETYRNADEYMKTFAGLLQITVRLEVKTIIGQGNEAAVFFELETKAPAEAQVLVAEWHQVKDGKIFHARSAFDGRPYAAMFSGASQRS